MVRKSVLHAFFHSVASLGYIPLALTSVLVSFSSPFVSIPPLGIILITFVPPLTSFPLLCFSYRYLEKLEWISLTVQRARTYIMLAGSGLCFLVAAHLMMVHLVSNEHNSGYNQMHYASSFPPSPAFVQSMLARSLVTTATPTTVIIKSEVGYGKKIAMNDSEGKNNGAELLSPPELVETDQTIPIIIPVTITDNMKKSSVEAEQWPSLLPSLLINMPTNGHESYPSFENKDLDMKEGERENITAVKQRQERPIDCSSLFKTLIPTHLLKPSKTPFALLRDANPDSELDSKQPSKKWVLPAQQEERDSSQQKQQQQQQRHSFLVTDPLLLPPPSSDGIFILDSPISTPGKSMISSQHSIPEPQTNAPAA
ncbi:hypothetical protein BGZ65_008946, partial [Modicella reniformis]